MSARDLNLSKFQFGGLQLSQNDRGTISITPDTYANKDTAEASRLAAGISMSMMRGIMSEKFQNGFALVRPPGHHAQKSVPMGFCLHNNAALAARQVLKRDN